MNNYVGIKIFHSLFFSFHLSSSMHCIQYRVIYQPWKPWRDWKKEQQKIRNFATGKFRVLIVLGIEAQGIRNPPQFLSRNWFMRSRTRAHQKTLNSTPIYLEHYLVWLLYCQVTMKVRSDFDFYKTNSDFVVSIFHPNEALLWGELRS